MIDNNKKNIVKVLVFSLFLGLIFTDLIAGELGQGQDKRQLDSKPQSQQVSDEIASSTENNKPGNIDYEPDAGLYVEVWHKFSERLGYGPEIIDLDPEYDVFSNFRYENTLAMYYPQKEWSEWKLFFRSWITFKSQTDVGVSFDEGADQVESNELELREFYVKANLFENDPRFSFSAGRQQFKDKYGLWWDDSIESLKLSFDSTFNKGFVSLSKAFANYRVKNNELEADDDDILYVMAELRTQTSKNRWWGSRVVYEEDGSLDLVRLDRQDFTGSRMGLFAYGSIKDRSAEKYDYHLEFMALKGHANLLDPVSSSIREIDASGWAFFVDVAKSFPLHDLRPRYSFSFGITDSSDNNKIGFFQGNLQTNRVTDIYAFSSGLMGSFIDFEFRNLFFYGLAAQFQPDVREVLTLKFYGLYKKSKSDPNLPITLKTDQVDINDRNLGHIVDAEYIWNTFPFAYGGKSVQINYRINLSYFRQGNGTTNIDDTFQSIISINMGF